MGTLNSELGSLSFAGFPFMKLKFEQKAVTSEINTRQEKSQRKVKAGKGKKV